MFVWAQVLRWAVNDYGYRLIDTAKYYDNECEIGTFMKSCTVPRYTVLAVLHTHGGSMPLGGPDGGGGI